MKRILAVIAAAVALFGAATEAQAGVPVRLKDQLVDSDGRVYVVDQWFRKIDVYRPASVKAGSGFLARKAAPAR